MSWKISNISNPHGSKSRMNFIKLITVVESMPTSDSWMTCFTTNLTDNTRIVTCRGG
ncbi:unnamed protein product [Brassica oleracea var. botrytis]